MRAQITSSGGSSPTLTLEEAIAHLESGGGGDILVNLGNGRTASCTSHRGEAGLLQRLRGHRMMIAMASGEVDVAHFATTPRDLKIAPLVQEILDAASGRD